VKPEDAFLYLKADRRIEGLFSNAYRPLKEPLLQVNFEKVMKQKDWSEMIAMSIYPRVLDLKATWDFYFFEDAELMGLKKQKLEILKKNAECLQLWMSFKTNSKPSDLSEGLSHLEKQRQELKTTSSNYQEKVKELNLHFKNE
jgi:hypothetical protein